MFIFSSISLVLGSKEETEQEHIANEVKMKYS